MKRMQWMTSLIVGLVALQCILSSVSDAAASLTDSVCVNNEKDIQQCEGKPEGTALTHSYGWDELDEETVPAITTTESLEVIQQHILQGIPFVIREEALNWPALELWSLDSLRQRFGKQVKNRHIDRGEAMFDESGAFLGYFDVSDEEWAAYLEAVEMEEARQKNIAWQCRNETASTLLRRDYRLPYFLARLGQAENDYVSENGAHETLFFALSLHEGREPHIDYSCNNAWSAQITGAKEWRLWAPNHCDNHLYKESGVNGSFECETAPPLRVLLNAGDVLFWYPGWMHATRAVEAESLGLSREFSSPIPIHMYTNYRQVYEQHSQKQNSYTRCIQKWDEARQKYQQAQQQLADKAFG
eukprot:m.121771 g.121771  ORF g.121771 m.121771 type:complete len:358 (-) comp15532_c0_seq2:1704-2777(-)